MTLILETRLSILKIMGLSLILIPFVLVLLFMITNLSYMKQQPIIMRVFLVGFTLFLGFITVKAIGVVFQQKVSIQIYKEGIFVASVSEQVIPWSVVKAITRPDHLGRTIHGIKASDLVRLELKSGAKLNFTASYKRNKWMSFPVKLDNPLFAISQHDQSPDTIYATIVDAFLNSTVKHE